MSAMGDGMTIMAAGMGDNGAATVRARRLSAGAARVDITPPAGIGMAGYAGRTVAQGIHDPLFARVVVLADGHVSLAIVSTDLVWLYSDRVVVEAKKKWNLDHVILCGTHTH